jgi:hypothetical protein
MGQAAFQTTLFPIICWPSACCGVSSGMGADPGMSLARLDLLKE